MVPSSPIYRRQSGGATFSVKAVRCDKLNRAATSGRPERFSADHGPTKEGKDRAAKLKAEGFSAWIELELTGYPAGVAVPEYRRVPAAAALGRAQLLAVLISSAAGSLYLKSYPSLKVREASLQ